MGDMKTYIYKYDQVYGKRVDPYVYRGYCTWGKYVATKMRDKGIVYKIAKPLALAWAKQMAFDLSKGRYGKNNKVVKVVSRIGESICYALGVVANINARSVSELSIVMLSRYGSSRRRRRRDGRRAYGWRYESQSNESR
jgi:hypothetical protein